MPLVAKGQKELGKGKSKQNDEEEKNNTEETVKEDESFVLVSNVPSTWHTHHLR